MTGSSYVRSPYTVFLPVFVPSLFSIRSYTPVCSSILGHGTSIDLSKASGGSLYVARRRTRTTRQANAGEQPAFLPRFDLKSSWLPERSELSVEKAAPVFCSNNSSSAPGALFSRSNSHRKWERYFGLQPRPLRQRPRLRPSPTHRRYRYGQAMFATHRSRERPADHARTARRLESKLLLHRQTCTHIHIQTHAHRHSPAHSGTSRPVRLQLLSPTSILLSGLRGPPPL